MEPIYLQSKSNDLPTLVRVVVTDGRRIVMERDLARALDRLVGPSGSVEAASGEQQPAAAESGTNQAAAAPLPQGIELPGFGP